MKRNSLVRHIQNLHTISRLLRANIKQDIALQLTIHEKPMAGNGLSTMWTKNHVGEAAHISESAVNGNNLI